MKQRGKGEGLVKTGDMAFLREVEDIGPRETPDNHPPAIHTEHNQQLSLWQNFLYNHDEEREGLSNAVDLWDSVPRYSISKQAQSKNRIHPARVPDLDGNERDFYPSTSSR